MLRILTYENPSDHLHQSDHLHSDHLHKVSYIQMSVTCVVNYEPNIIKKYQSLIAYTITPFDAATAIQNAAKAKNKPLYNEIEDLDLIA